MDVTMDIEVEHQITQPESQLAVMETCYEEPTLEETYMAEEVQMRSQAQKQGQQHQGSQSQFQKHQYLGQNRFQGNQNYNKSGYGSGYKSQYNKGKTKVMVTKLHTRDNNSLHQIKHLYNSLELTWA